MDPVQVIEEDIRILEILTKDIQTSNVENIIVNCEHVVPQSWFSKKEPMRGICITYLPVNQLVTVAEGTIHIMTSRIMCLRYHLEV